MNFDPTLKNYNQVFVQKHENDKINLYIPKKQNWKNWGKFINKWFNTLKSFHSFPINTGKSHNYVHTIEGAIKKFKARWDNLSLSNQMIEQIEKIIEDRKSEKNENSIDQSKINNKSTYTKIDNKLNFKIPLNNFFVIGNMYFHNTKITMALEILKEEGEQVCKIWENFINEKFGTLKFRYSSPLVYCNSPIGLGKFHQYVYKIKGSYELECLLNDLHISNEEIEEFYKIGQLKSMNPRKNN